MGRIATFDLLRFPGSVVRPAGRVPKDRRALRQVDGLVLGRLLGTAAGSSTAGGADLHRWAVFAVWEDVEARDDFWSLDELGRRWQRSASERWSATLVPRHSRGRWAGVEPFAEGDLTSRTDGPVAVLTRATVRARRLRRFASARPSVDASFHAADGLLAAVGMGEWPVGQQATFSLWRTSAAARAFAWADPTHVDVIRRTRAERWYAEELFATFTITRHAGFWDSCDPLATTIRLATSADIAGLNDLERGAARRFAGLGLGALDDALDTELLHAGVAENRLWVADDAGTVVGFALATVVDGQGFLREIDVAESHGRHGVGTSLVEAVLAWARRHGHTSVGLTTFEEVPWTAPWYARLGFQFVPEHERGPELTAIVARERREGLTRRTVMRLALTATTTAG